MNKKITSIFLALFFVVGLTLAGHAAPVSAAPGDMISVHGKITNDATGKPVAGASVQVSCNGSLVGISNPTDGNGNYAIDVPADSCPLGGDLVVTITIDDLSGLAVSTITYDNTVSVALHKSLSIPEYGWLSGITASSAAIGAVAFVRRHAKQNI